MTNDQKHPQKVADSSSLQEELATLRALNLREQMETLRALNAETLRIASQPWWLPGLQGAALFGGLFGAALLIAKVTF